MTTSKRRTAQQIAADAHLAYRASVAKQLTAAREGRTRLIAAGHRLDRKAEQVEAALAVAEGALDALEAELAQIDRATAMLAPDTATTDALLALIPATGGAR